MEMFNQLQQEMLAAQADLEKFYGKGNKSAATRARKSLSNMRHIANDLRKQILIDKENQSQS